MPYRARTTRREHRKPRSRSRQSLQKPNGIIGPRVQKVGGDRFAIVCVDPAKHRSEWMMADYFGNLLIKPQTIEHRAVDFKLAVLQIREAQQQHDIQDTIVVVDGAILGKPADARDARDMLLRLSGREHMVITAFRIVHMERNVHEKGAVETTVKVKTLEKQDVEGYIRTGEPIGKAGGYAIQGIGAFMVESISGSYTNVVGLPLFEVLETLRALGALRFFA